MPIPKQRRERSRYSLVSDSEGSYAALDAYWSRYPKPYPTYNTSNVPLELWTIIARFTSRQSLARLCSVSHYLCSALTSLLYANTIDPPLTPSQSALLIQTLSSDVQRCSCLICARTQTLVHGKPHPALAALIRDLGLVEGAADQTFRDKPKLLKTLSQLEAAQVRTLHWSLAAGVDDLVRILGAPGRFPYLKELVVSCDGTNKNFNFVLVPRLEVLGVEINLSSLVENANMDWGVADRPCYRLAESLQMVSCTSPLLHTLRLKLKLPFDEDMEFPDDGYSDLVAAINDIHLPALATLEISVDLVSDYWYQYGCGVPRDLPKTDFSPFFTSHPNLHHLKLNMPGIQLSKKKTFLPQLRSFQGSFEHAAVICAGPHKLQKLVIALIHLNLDPLPSFKTVHLASDLSLTHLHIFAVDAAGKTIKTRNELSPASFRQLVSSFPNLTHLDVCISQRMIHYCGHLILLARLQSLRFQEYRTRWLGPPKWPARLVFPPEDYIEEFTLFLPSQPRLKRIEISLLGDTYPNSQSFGFKEMGETPELSAEYFFSVLRPSGGNAYVVLDRAHVVDRCEIGDTFWLTGL
ncbi:hypothetical protein DFH08DRAFT_1078827 [Mycena albidolilacea]|uniref:Uncharacterized protein n=1 Tax=Mycena albidolilacea TaxID=1033008 RepID=A0AAD7A7G0_9AGAR|nr:hypothetical protein DFH08DRAFT_1078827 [Mycena albidolilacea]